MQVIQSTGMDKDMLLTIYMDNDFVKNHLCLFHGVVCPIAKTSEQSYNSIRYNNPFNTTLFQ